MMIMTPTHKVVVFTLSLAVLSSLFSIVSYADDPSFETCDNNLTFRTLGVDFPDWLENETANGGLSYNDGTNGFTQSTTSASQIAYLVAGDSGTFNSNYSMTIEDVTSSNSDSYTVIAILNNYEATTWETLTTERFKIFLIFQSSKWELRYVTTGHNDAAISGEISSSYPTTFTITKNETAYNVSDDDGHSYSIALSSVHEGAGDDFLSIGKMMSNYWNANMNLYEKGIDIQYNCGEIPPVVPNATECLIYLNGSSNLSAYLTDVVNLTTCVNTTNASASITNIYLNGSIEEYNGAGCTYDVMTLDTPMFVWENGGGVAPDYLGVYNLTLTYNETETELGCNATAWLEIVAPPVVNVTDYTRCIDDNWLQNIYFTNGTLSNLTEFCPYGCDGYNCKVNPDLAYFILFLVLVVGGYVILRRKK